MLPFIIRPTNQMCSSCRWINALEDITPPLFEETLKRYQLFLALLFFASLRYASAVSGKERERERARGALQYFYPPLVG